MLRHSLATHLLHQGVGVKTIGDTLGHRAIQSTSTYPPHFRHSRIGFHIANEVFAPCQENAASRPLCPPTNPATNPAMILPQRAHRAQRHWPKKELFCVILVIFVVNKLFKSLQRKHLNLFSNKITTILKILSNIC
jgi:hypothetical protein